MATAKKTAPAAKKTVAAVKPVAAVTKAAPAGKKATAVSTKAAPPATKAAAPASSKPAVASKKAAPVAPKVAQKVAAAAPAKAPAVKTATVMKPIKTAFNKTALAAHLAATADVDPKSVKAVLAALEATILASIHKKGLGEFTLPGLIKISAQNVPAKKKRMGKDPFTGVERQFAAKPASTKIKARALKKLKDAAL